MQSITVHPFLRLLLLFGFAIAIFPSARLHAAGQIGNGTSPVVRKLPFRMHWPVVARSAFIVEQQ